MTRIALFAVSLSVALLGCRGGDDGGDDQPGMDGSGSNAGEVTIQEVQNDAMAVGTMVELRGVVVTAIDAFGERTGDLFVGEPEGGAFSGVKVYGAPVDVLATLQIGDLVDITNAEKHEACTASAPCGPVVFDDGASLTEVQGISVGSLTITKVGTGTVPTPSEVDAKAMATMTRDARIAEWEKWEGVLIKVTNARQLTQPANFGSGTGVDSKEFRITGVARVQSVLTDMPTTAVAGTCYDSVTGVGDFFFSNLILPRSAADFGPAGTGCNPMVESISALQSATTPPELVRLTDAVVTAVSTNKKNFWVSTSATAAANEGVYVFRCSGSNCDNTSELPATVVPGRKVTIAGEGVEFPGTDGTGPSLTQIGSPSITVSADAPLALTPVSGQTVADLIVASTGEAYEGVLVTLANVQATTVSDASPYVSDFHQFPANTAFKVDDDIFRFNKTNDQGDCYATVTGIWTFNAFQDIYQFLPTAVGTGTGTCTTN